MSLADQSAAVVVTVMHTCHGTDHTAPVTFTRHVQLTDGRVDRLEGVRCDGSPIHHYQEAGQ